MWGPTLFATLVPLSAVILGALLRVMWVLARISQKLDDHVANRDLHTGSDVVVRHVVQEDWR